MSVTTINNQAVKLYTPLETLFNDNDGVCKWHHDYAQLITCDDVTEIIINSEVETADSEKDGDMLFNITGTNTSVAANTLTDAVAAFIGAGVIVGMVVRNIADDTTAKVTIVANKVLTLDADIFPAFPVAYSVSNYELSGNMTFGTGEFVKVSGALGSAKQDVIITVDNLYKMEIDITSFSTITPGAQIRLKIGGDTVITLDETDNPTGTQTIFAYSNGADPTAVEINVDSGINATFSTLRVSQMSNVVFFVAECDDDTIVYSSIPTDVTASNTSAQIKISFDWSNLQDGYNCQGCYYIKIINR